jgi:hypothetical protein
MNDDFDSVCIITMFKDPKYKVWIIHKVWENGWHWNVNLCA